MKNKYDNGAEFVDIRRGILALAIGALSTVFNYSSIVETLPDAALWFSFLAVGSYVILTALSVVLARVW